MSKWMERLAFWNSTKMSTFIGSISLFPCSGASRSRRAASPRCGHAVGARRRDLWHQPSQTPVTHWTRTVLSVWKAARWQKGEKLPPLGPRRFSLKDSWPPSLYSPSWFHAYRGGKTFLKNSDEIWVPSFYPSILRLWRSSVLFIAHFSPEKIPAPRAQKKFDHSEETPARFIVLNLERKKNDNFFYDENTHWFFFWSFLQVLPNFYDYRSSKIYLTFALKIFFDKK